MKKSAALKQEAATRTKKAKTKNERTSRLAFAGHCLAQVRTARGLSVEELGERSGIDPAAITCFESYWAEAGAELGVAPTADHLYALAHALDIGVEKLGDGSDKMRSNYKALTKPPKSGDWSFDGAKLRAMRIRSGKTLAEAAIWASVPQNEIEYLEDESAELAPSFVVLRLIAALDRRPLAEAIGSYVVRQ